MMHPSYSPVVPASHVNAYGGPLKTTWGNYGGGAVTYVDVVVPNLIGGGTTPDWEDTILWRVQSDGILVRDPYNSLGMMATVSPSSSQYADQLRNIRHYGNASAVDQVLGGGAVSVTQSNQGVGKVMQNIAAFFGVAGTPEERKAAQQRLLDAAAQYGPGIISGVQTLVGNSGSSLSSLQRQLARKKAKYYTTTNPTKKLELQYEIEALESQIANYHTAIAGVNMGGGSNGEKKEDKSFPIWIPIAVLAAAGLVTGAVVLSRRQT